MSSWQFFAYSISWENPTTLQDSLVYKGLYRRRNAWRGSSAGLALFFTLVPRHTEKQHLRAHQWPGRTWQFILREGTVFLLRGCYFPTWPLWVSGKRQYNIQSPTTCWRRKSTNQAVRPNGKTISKKGSILPNPRRKSLLYIASKSFWEWYKLRSREFFSLHRYLVTKKKKKKMLRKTI